ncbi:MAG: LysM peptidoglycan-binding domain-containing protein [Planctomycetes bacterium]|nr:LysM peptidoglycan-binding domain-containing protein [Planctomycetota bacterium]
MRTIGSIEKVLVGGIVIVIGAILAVAIKGAGDFDAALREKNLASAPKGGDHKDANAKSQPAKGPGGNKQNQAGGRTLRNDRPVEPPANPQGGVAAGQPEVDKLGAKKNDPAAPDPAAPPVRSTDGLELPVVPPTPGGATPPIGSDERRGNGAIDSSSGNPDLDALLNRRVEELVHGSGAGSKSVRPEDIGDHAEVVPDPADGQKPPVVIDPPAVAPVTAPEAWAYEVRSGDSLERIARALYGEGGEYQAILAANPRLADKNTIRVGQRLVLPRAPTQGKELAIKGGATATPAALPAPATDKPDAERERSETAKAAKGSAFKRVGSAVEHVVVSGDTLMSIALEHYGTKAAWRLIYDANTAAIPDKDRIKVGARFKLPAQ